MVNKVRNLDYSEYCKQRSPHTIAKCSQSFSVMILILKQRSYFNSFSYIFPRMCFDNVFTSIEHLCCKLDTERIMYFFFVSGVFNQPSGEYPHLGFSMPNFKKTKMFCISF